MSIGPTRCWPPPGRPRSTSAGRSTRCDPTRRRSGRGGSIVDEVERCRSMGAHAAALVPPSARILTHCNAGGLATGGYGSAVGAIRAASERTGVTHVWVDETRPLLQGARLTAFELEALGIPHAVIVDGAAASRMAAGEVDIVITGADRIAANGDTANKIGTYGLAVLARHHGIPFVIVAPTSTIDPAAPDGRLDPGRGTRWGRGDGAIRGAQPSVRRHARRSDRCDRDRGGRASRPVLGVAPRARGLAMILDEVDPEAREILQRSGFPAEEFERLRAGLFDGSRTAHGNVVTGLVEPPLPSDLTTLPAPGEQGFERGSRGGTSRAARGADCDGRPRRRDGDALRRRGQGRRRGDRRAQLPRRQARRDPASRRGARRPTYPWR